ncbi:MAG: hypothetical protein DYG85_12975 [Chloroflexi bacterium CFX1]|nr:hypothetical protein [Chloroflexi bacterium CFX1]
MRFDFLSLVIFFLALGGMIFVHELGHFIAARWAKIEVEEFGFGLPSYKIATLFRWQGTEFTLHALPLGGFVRPKGENDPNVPGGYGAASPWKRPRRKRASTLAIFSSRSTVRKSTTPTPPGRSSARISIRRWNLCSSETAN